MMELRDSFADVTEYQHFMHTGERGALFRVSLLHWYLNMPNRQGRRTDTVDFYAAVVGRDGLWKVVHTREGALAHPAERERLDREDRAAYAVLNELTGGALALEHKRAHRSARALSSISARVSHMKEHTHRCLTKHTKNTHKKMAATPNKKALFITARANAPTSIEMPAGDAGFLRAKLSARHVNFVPVPQAVESDTYLCLVVDDEGMLVPKPINRLLLKNAGLLVYGAAVVVKCTTEEGETVSMADAAPDWAAIGAAFKDAGHTLHLEVRRKWGMLTDVRGALGAQVGGRGRCLNIEDARR